MTKLNQEGERGAAGKGREDQIDGRGGSNMQSYAFPHLGSFCMVASHLERAIKGR
jgi:hypothetical protein